MTKTLLYARESVAFDKVLTLVDADGAPIDITGWTFELDLTRQAGSPDLTLDMDTATGDGGFAIVDGEAGELRMVVQQAALAGVDDTTGDFTLFGDLLGTAPSSSPVFVSDIRLNVTVAGSNFPGSSYQVTLEAIGAVLKTELTSIKEAAVTASVANRLARYEELQRPNLIDWGPEYLDQWNVSTTTATLSWDEVDGRGVLKIDAPSAATVMRNFQVDENETEFTYSLQLEAKTGGSGVSSGRLVIYELAEAEGEQATGYTIVGSPNIHAFPSGDVAAPVQISGTLTKNAATKRFGYSIETQNATSISVSQAIAGYGPLAGLRKPPADVAGALNRSNHPMSQGFDRRYIVGAINGMTGRRSNTCEWFVNDDGDLEIVAGENAVRLYRYRGLMHNRHCALEVSTAATVTGADTATGCIISIGDIDGTGAGSRRHYAYLGNGFIGVLDNNSVAVAGGAVAGMEFAQGERAALRLVTFVSKTGLNSGYLLATAPNGETHKFPVTDIPDGAIASAWRRAVTGKIHYLNAAPLSQTTSHHEERLDEVESALGVGGTAAVLKSYALLPDAPGREQGWTCTGMDRITRGQYAGFWVSGDAGRNKSDDAAAWAGKIHIVSPDFREIIATIDTGLAEAVQGVTIDTSGAADTVWAAISTAQEIRHYNLDGTEIVADRIDWAALGYANNPNGLAYEAASDALLVGTAEDAIVRRLACDPAANPRLIDSFNAVVGMDQFHLDETRGLLYYTLGGNGVDASVGVYRMATDTASIAYANLKHNQAGEGLFIDRDNFELITPADGYFHAPDGAEPSFNAVLRYRVPLLT